jgi:hypothetical protein
MAYTKSETDLDQDSARGSEEHMKRRSVVTRNADELLAGRQVIGNVVLLASELLWAWLSPR